MFLAATGSSVQQEQQGHPPDYVHQAGQAGTQQIHGKAQKPPLKQEPWIAHTDSDIPISLVQTYMISTSTHKRTK